MFLINKYIIIVIYTNKKKNSIEYFLIIYPLYSKKKHMNILTAAFE